MIIPNRYSNLELLPYVCASKFVQWLGERDVLVSDIESFFKKHYPDSYLIIQTRTLNFLYILGAIEYDPDSNLLRKSQ